MTVSPPLPTPMPEADITCQSTLACCAQTWTQKSESNVAMQVAITTQWEKLSEMHSICHPWSVDSSHSGVERIDWWVDGVLVARRIVRV